MVDDVQVVKGIYDKLARGDVAGILASFAPDAEFRLAEGHPYKPDGHPWTGPDQIGREFFGRAGREWTDFAISTTAFYEARDAVVVEARYAGLYRPTGRRQRTQVCHVWTIRDGLVTSFHQYADTAHLCEVMGAADPPGAQPAAPSEAATT
jgi:ketosteroid isomerase-like protein